MKSFTVQTVRVPVSGAELEAWLYLPSAAGPHPAIVMSHGFSAVKELYLDTFAERFAQAGFVVVVFDHRGFGNSTGPRQEADPILQSRDYRDVITWAGMRDDVDAARIGIWGTSYSGGHVLLVAAQDKRVKCVVSQVPTISGYEQTRRRTPPHRLAGMAQAFAAERERLAQGQEPTMRAVIPLAGKKGAVFDTPDAIAFFGSAETGVAPSWRNEVTMKTLEHSAEYEPGAFVERISPTPLLMVVADNDVITPTDLALDAYQRAREPKRLVLLPGGHFDPYIANVEAASSAATDWFVQHLQS